MDSDRRARRYGAVAAATAAALLAGTAPAGASQPAPPSGQVTVVAHTVDEQGRPGFHDITAPTREQAERAAAAVPGVRDVELDVPVQAVAGDPRRGLQWSHDALHVDALPAMPGPALVAVIDSGVAVHEDLSGQVRCDLGMDLVGDGKSTDGCVDPNGHGTHVAGIVAAVTGNDTGVAGLAPSVRILPMRVLGESGAGLASHVATAIVAAVDRGASVINLSLAGSYSQAQAEAVAYAVSKDVLVVAAAGNNRKTGNTANYPAAFPAVLSVAATDSTGTSGSFSYAGPSVDLAAPGVGILSTVPGGYATKSGTSMAAPAVAAVAARYRAAHPAKGQSDVVATLTATATDVETPGRDDNTGAGVVDAYRALTGRAYGAPVPPEPPAPDPAPTPDAAPDAAPAPTPLTPAPADPPPVLPAPAPAPVDPAPVVPAPPPAPFVPAPVAPAPVAPAPVAPAPQPSPVVPTPVVVFGDTTLTRGERVEVTVRDLRPGSVVRVTHSYRTSVRKRVTRSGISRSRTATVTRTAQLGSFRAGPDGSVSLSVLPVQRAAEGTLVVEGTDRGGQPTSTSTPVRVTRR